MSLLFPRLFSLCSWSTFPAIQQLNYRFTGPYGISALHSCLKSWTFLVKKKKKKNYLCVLLYSRFLCLQKLQALPTTLPQQLVLTGSLIINTMASKNMCASFHLSCKTMTLQKTGRLQWWSWSNITYDAQGLSPWRYQIIHKRSQDGGHLTLIPTIHTSFRASACVISARLLAVVLSL